MELAILCGIFPHIQSECGIFSQILPVPLNIVMDLNNVMLLEGHMIFVLY